MLNQVQIIGHLGKDPEIRKTQSGMTIANLTVATSEKWKDKKSGELKEHTEWHRVVLFDKLGDIAERYLTKGSLCYLAGKLQTRSWTDEKTGTTKYATEIHGNELKLLGGKSDKPKQEKAETPAPNLNDIDDDIPF